MKVARLWITLIVTSLCLTHGFASPGKNGPEKKGLPDKRGGNGKNPVTHATPGFRIQPDFSEQVEIGERAIFNGTICHYKKHPVFDDKASCRAFDEDEKRDYRVRFFYPNLSNEVTSNVSLNKSGEGLSYSFESEEVKVNSPKHFHVIVEEEDAHSYGEAVSQEKIANYVEIIEERIENVSDKDVGEKLENLKDIVKNAKDKVASSLRKNEEILATLKMPLQIGNEVIGEMEKSAVFGDIKITLNNEHAQIIEGERTKYKATVTRLFEEGEGVELEKEKEHDEGKKRQWHFDIDYHFKGELLTSKSDLDLGAGEEAHFEHSSEGLFKGDLSNLNVVVNRSKEIPKHGAAYSMMQDWERGNLSINSFIHGDSLNPLWKSLTIEKDEIYVQRLNSFGATVLDDFGRVNKDSLAVDLNGVLFSGENHSVDFLDQLSVEVKEEKLKHDNGSAKYRLSGEIAKIPEGDFTLAGEAQDFAGNVATFEKIVHIDRTRRVSLLGKKMESLQMSPHLHCQYPLKITHPLQLRSSTIKSSFMRGVKKSLNSG